MILVTGATGKVGGELVPQLLQRGAPVRVLTRNAANAKFPTGVSVAEGDAGSPEALIAALDGVDAVFFMAPDNRLPSHAEILAQVARKAGARHITLLSSLAVEMPDDNPLAVEHRAAEQTVGQSGCTWTMLRAGVFASNTLAWAGSIRGEGVVRSVLKNHPFAPVDPYDVAAVAAESLVERRHETKTYRLTGPDMITPKGQIAVLSSLLGRPLKFVELPEREALAAFLATYPRQTEGTFRALRQENLPWTPPLPDIAEVTGRQPRSFREWAAYHIDAFRS